MDVEYDEAKRQLTLRERGLDFARAEEVFDGLKVHLDDDRIDYGEARVQTMGFLDGELIMVVWTRRGSKRRVISMRRCNDREQRKFDKLIVGRS